jgi:hypothetical protein
VIANLLWAGLGLGVLLGLIGIRVSDRRAAWTAALLSTAILIAFSLAAGFSIGPFTIAFPVLLTAIFLSRGMGLLLRALVVAVAAATYWLIIWRFGSPGALLMLSGLLAAAYLAAVVWVVTRRSGSQSYSRQRS